MENRLCNVSAIQRPFARDSRGICRRSGAATCPLAPSRWGCSQRGRLCNRMDKPGKTAMRTAAHSQTDKALCRGLCATGLRVRGVTHTANRRKRGKWEKKHWALLCNVSFISGIKTVRHQAPKWAVTRLTDALHSGLRFWIKHYGFNSARLQVLIFTRQTLFTLFWRIRRL